MSRKRVKSEALSPDRGSGAQPGPPAQPPAESTARSMVADGHPTGRQPTIEQLKFVECGVLLVRDVIEEDPHVG